MGDSSPEAGANPGIGDTETANQLRYDQEPSGDDSPVGQWDLVIGDMGEREPKDRQPNDSGAMAIPLVGGVGATVGSSPDDEADRPRQQHPTLPAP